LDTTGGFYIRNVDQVRVHENEIFVLDKAQKSVFRYNRDGRYLSKVQSIGQGPGEYQNVMDFLLIDNKIYILEFQGTIMIYDFEGEFVEKIDLPFQSNYFEFLGESIFVFQDIRIDGNIEYLVGIYCINSKEIIDSIETTEGINDDSYPFLRSKHLWLDSDDVYFNYDYSNVIYKISNKQIIPILQILSKELPDNRDIKQYAKNPIQRQQDSWDKIFNLENIIMYDNMISFTCVLNKRYVRVFYSAENGTVQCFRECHYNFYAHKAEDEVFSYDFPGLFKDVNKNPIIITTAVN
jgi:hypothetical protein